VNFAVNMQSTMTKVYSQYIILPVYLILHVVVYLETIIRYISVQYRITEFMWSTSWWGRGKNVLFCRVLVIHFL